MDEHETRLDDDVAADPPRDGITLESALAAAPGLMRLTAGAWLRTASWTADAALRTSRRLGRAAISGESPAHLLEEATGELRRTARRALGVADIEARLAELVPGVMQNVPSSDVDSPHPPSLRDRGAELLSRSADVSADDGIHPAFIQILSQLAPDEGRILRLLAIGGAQPAVDVRTWRPLDVGSQLVAGGLSMIGAEAGCRYVDRVPEYLNNLHRLGLIWFSREPVEDRQRYQVLEAQPDVIEAMREAGRARTVRRSISLTPFGEDFCETCLPLHTADLEALPGDAPTRS